MPPLTRQRIIIASAMAVGAILVLLYAFVDPQTHIYPRCVFLSLTGLQCPGCGSQRALHALLTGDIAAAWSFNALLVAAIPILALMLVAAWQRTRRPRLYNVLNSTPAIIVWAIVVAAWWIGRNI